MRERFRRFMHGRYGTDQLGKLLAFLSVFFVALSLFLRNLGGLILWAAALILLLVCYFRMFSSNLDRRRAENERYLSFVKGIGAYFQGKKRRFKQRKDYRFFDCPQCGVTARVPRGKGRIRITCPKCGNCFVRKS